MTSAVQTLVHYLLQPKIVVLGLVVASALAVHLRGRVRLKFARQLTDHSTLIAPYNAFAYLTSRRSGEKPSCNFFRRLSVTEPMFSPCQCLNANVLATYFGS